MENNCSVDTWNNKKNLTKLIPEFQQLMLDKKLSTKVALIYSAMPHEEQLELYNAFGEEKAPDMTIVSGHQRLKACEDLGIKKVPVIIREDLDDEDEKLKKLLATNFMRQKNDPAKQVKVASEYVGLVGLKQGRPDKNGDSRHLLSQEEIAQSLGISERTLRELLEIDRKLIPQIRELFDNGDINKKTANKVWCRLSPEDQEKFFNEIGRDKISQMTQVQTQKYIDDLRRVEIEKQQLQSELQKEKNKQPEIKVVEKVVDNTDYETIKKLNTELEEKTRVYNIVKDNEEKYKRLMMSYKQDRPDKTS